jgi:hypothetical protein
MKAYEYPVAALNPTKVCPPMSTGRVLAVAANIFPTTPNPTPEIKNQRRPKISVKRPTRVRPMARLRVKTSASQMTGPGPIAASIWPNTFKTEDEIVALSNNTEYGLMAGVFTQDINRALRVASEFDSGMVGVNCVSNLTMFVNVPFGGTKQSGLGREGGKASLLAFTDPKTIMVNLTY